MWKPETPGRRKFALIAASAVFLLTWMLLLFWIIRNFGLLTADGRFFAILLLAIYPTPWVQTMRENPASAAMVTITYLALAFAVLMVRHLTLAH